MSALTAATAISTATASASTRKANTSARQGRSAIYLLPGLALCGSIALVAIKIGKHPWLQAHGLSALTLAIFAGIIIGNTVFSRFAPSCAMGVSAARQTVLRVGIILYGFRVTFQDISHVGIAGVLIDVLVLTSTFSMAVVLGINVFRLDRNTAIMIGAGSAICGAAAIMATQPVVRGRADQVTVAVSTVIIFGTLAIFVYPILHNLNLDWHVIGQTPSAFGVYIGSTLHEVAQVVATAQTIDPEATNSAVIAKMVRVMMLAPFLIALAAWMARSNRTHADAPSHLAIPWFAFGFLGVVGLNSLFSLPMAVTAAITAIDTFLLAMAMAALGLTTHVSAIRRAGPKPLILAGLLFCWLVAGGAAINQGVMKLFG